ncbi:L domain-like protein [Neocallimastix lanati (nom. inval.)]|jgi:hypothetical protein|uniref:L domain-like protein n=1 Tax=Neocallimastix californiae TaxID=1754190 RepID=A0A1Y2ANF2_9FUNG|nr:L domain-like protein [Neocallimastix sp. JGI-2020a]ORY24081.1 L domain-like protein [Neocallimastix californiae]|eukprot:ORY24081.1 L domain-like protein [Neocallimastix californiae]
MNGVTKLFILLLFTVNVFCQHALNDYDIEEFDTASFQESIRVTHSDCHDSRKLSKFLKNAGYFMKNGYNKNIVTCKDDNMFKLELNFKNNSFIDFSEFPLFEDLTILNIKGNAFVNKTIPNRFFKLPNLKYLYISSPINEVPKNFDEDSPIENIIFDKCEFTKFPYQLKKLENLKNLNLNFNKISGSLTNEIKEFKNLEKLKLKANKLKGELIIPDNLNEIYIDGNGFTSYSVNNTNEELIKFSGSFNDFDNNFLMELTKLKSLKYINIGNNKQITEIPSNIYQLEDLEILNVKATSIQKLPNNLFKLKNLKVLDISNNQQLKAKIIKLEDNNTINNCRLYDTNILCYEKDACDEIFGKKLERDEFNYTLCTDEEINDIRMNMDRTVEEEKLLNKNSSSIKTIAYKYISFKSIITLIIMLIVIM